MSSKLGARKESYNPRFEKSLNLGILGKRAWQE